MIIWRSGSVFLRSLAHRELLTSNCKSDASPRKPLNAAPLKVPTPLFPTGPKSSSPNASFIQLPPY